ncbi:anion-transporting ArsA/GET3 family ATPase [Nocardioides zeae]|uniref:Anion-transporting ArsA/GET3 family ATPase n=1 Tax=Nocardioides zeae TaxID=1457234 RepID=A0ACC6IM91_9ACTN|nr:ArsA-related P-loop ATPase [Nocardioides zeae]MDR6173846.1 anion-transporting ArsA/GET3 family ATPase [Nocardioides zeae]MDR6211866.1 anion-transporting ArsA/GET3 family ATPase [Nocardioides zeae]
MTVSSTPGGGAAERLGSHRRSSHRVGRLAGDAAEVAPHLDLDALIDDRGTGIVVCCGSGGVGKTTTAAALAMRAAERGRKVVVLTIDPARRLAQSMGIEELDNTPRPVVGIDPAGGGSLDAMMLDMKSTFDEVVESQASPEKARAILDNPFYVALSSSFAGTQEYMAMEKLGQIHRQAKVDGTYDLIVVDTPPSRSALDFLDAPERLSSFLDGRFIKLLLAPAKGPAKVLGMGFGLITGALTKVLGAQVLTDLQTFVAAFDTVFGGFRQRAQQTYALLQDAQTAFVVVAAPERDALREAAYFVERLADDRMPLAGLVVNRAHPQPPVDLGAEEAVAAARWLARNAETEGNPGGTALHDPALAEGLLRLHADHVRITEREGELRRRFAATHPEVATAVVPALASDVHDLDGLRRVGELLAVGRV